MTDGADRAARKRARGKARRLAAKSDVSAEIELVYGKPIEEWDDEELV